VDASSQRIGDSSSIDVDSRGRPHIAYWDNTNLYLKHAYKIGSGGNCGGGEWTCEEIGPAFWGAFPSIDVDEDDNIHISYLGSMNRDLNYAYFDGRMWSIQTVDSAGEVGFYTSIAASLSNQK